MRAIFCAAQRSRVPQSQSGVAAQDTRGRVAWQWHRLASRHTVASATVTCLRHSSNGRPICAAQKFPQEQVSSDVPPAQKMGDLSRRARMPARPRIRSVYAMEVICRPRSAPIAQTPINLFNSHRRRCYHRRRCSLLNVVRMLGPGEPVRTEC